VHALRKGHSANVQGISCRYALLYALETWQPCNHFGSAKLADSSNRIAAVKFASGLVTLDTTLPSMELDVVAVAASRDAREGASVTEQKILPAYKGLNAPNIDSER
jgi:hypothetical protein